MTRHSALHAALLLGIAAGSCFGQPAAQTALDFKSVPFGTSRAELRAIFPSLHCSAYLPANQDLGDEGCQPQYCSASDVPCNQSAKVLNTYAGRPAEVTLILIEDRFEGFDILMSPTDFEVVRDSLKDRFPLAKETSRNVVTRTGVTLKSRRLQVSAQAQSALLLTEHAGQIDQMSLTARSGTFFRLIEAKKKRQTERGKSDL